MTFGERLRESRKLGGYSLRDLAERVGVSASFLVDIEHNVRRPNGDVLKKIGLAIGETNGLVDHCFTRDDARKLEEDDELVVLIKRALRDDGLRRMILRAGRPR
jgi:transcriptional regulator with XRE-family HTH domain